MIDCTHWKANHTTWAGGGECTAGVYHHPSAGTCARCPSRSPLATPAVPLVQVTTPTNDPYDFERLWHAYAEQNRPWSFGELWDLLHRDATGSPALIDFVRARLPCGECSRHFAAYVLAHPPSFGVEWFRWTWELHNAVNALRGVEPFPLAAATARYRAAA